MYNDNVAQTANALVGRMNTKKEKKERNGHDELGSGLK
jgi:hypothetical protein